MASSKGPGGRLRGFLTFLRRENLHRLIVVIAVIVLVGAVGMWLTEDRTFLDSLWWSIVTVTTVGFGDISPATVPGRIIGVVLMFVGIGVLGMFTATIAGLFVEQRLMKERGMGSFDFKDHIILCEWNHTAERILEDLRADPRCETLPVVLLAEVDAKPLDDPNLHFVRGAVTEENLKRCALGKASTVLILGDRALDDNARDAKVVLSCLAVETINPDAYTIAELTSENNAKHCERARVDEVIISSEFSSRLMASAALDHGVTRVLSELISPHYGSNIVIVDLPADHVGKTFLDAYSALKRERNQTLLALERGDHGKLMTNPPADLELQAGDRLLAIVSAGATDAGAA